MLLASLAHRHFKDTPAQRELHPNGDDFGRIDDFLRTIFIIYLDECRRRCSIVRLTAEFIDGLAVDAWQKRD